MKKIILNDTFWAKLGSARETLELCDEQGAVRGRFTPLAEMQAAYGSEPRLTEEELLRIEQEPDISTDELLEQLRKL